jgi:hypothetical protein
VKKALSAACALLFIVAMGFAQAAPAKVLDQKTLDKFLADYPKIVSDGEAEGITLEESAGPGGADPAAAMANPDAGSLSKMMRDSMDSMKRNPAARRLLAKHGWDDSFWDILFVVGASVGVLSMEESFEGQPLPEQIKPFVDDLRGAVHPSDLSLVKKDRAKIESALAERGE